MHQMTTLRTMHQITKNQHSIADDLNKKNISGDQSNRVSENPQSTTTVSTTGHKASCAAHPHHATSCTSHKTSTVSKHDHINQPTPTAKAAEGLFHAVTAGSKNMPMYGNNLTKLVAKFLTISRNWRNNTLRVGMLIRIIRGLWYIYRRIYSAVVPISLKLWHKISQMKDNIIFNQDSWMRRWLLKICAWNNDFWERRWWFFAIFILIVKSPLFFLSPLNANSWIRSWLSKIWNTFSRIVNYLRVIQNRLFSVEDDPPKRSKLDYLRWALVGYKMAPFLWYDNEKYERFIHISIFPFRIFISALFRYIRTELQVMHQWRPRGDAPTRMGGGTPTYYLAKFSQKLHENEEN